MALIDLNAASRHQSEITVSDEPCWCFLMRRPRTVSRPECFIKNDLPLDVVPSEWG